MKKHKQLIAFTLAEVLISLGIIGIVAALTITALNRAISTYQYEVALKKVYSELSQAYISMSSDNGGSVIGLFPDRAAMLSVFKVYLKDAKTCDENFTTGECWHKSNEWYGLTGTPVSSTETFSSSLIMPSGAILLFNSPSSTCTSNSELNSNIGCGRIRVDINGFQKPNRIGRDIFDFYITSSKVIARGDPLTTNDEAAHPCASDSWSCAYRILTKGMDY